MTMQPLQPLYEVPPSVDDEITVTVRIRLEGPVEAFERAFAAAAPGVVAEAIWPLCEHHPDAHLAGIEVSLPTWRPYGRVLPPATEETQP